MPTLSDPFGDTAPPLDLGQFEDVGVKNRVRRALALSCYRGTLVTLDDQEMAMGQVTEQLAKSSVWVLVRHRPTGRSFQALIPGPGELEDQYWEWMVHPYLLMPLEDDIILFDPQNGLSSCSDYFIQGTFCPSCDRLVDTVDNLCYECTQKLLADTGPEDNMQAFMDAIACPNYGDQPQPI